MSTRLPFFVYGTLLPGQPNYHLWGSTTVAERPATFVDGQLFDMGYYPMLVEGGGSIVKGILVTVDHASYQKVLQRIDMLEGFNPREPAEGAYQRHRRSVFVNGQGRILAWVYLGLEKYAAGAPLIESGDWVAYAAEKLVDISQWWAEQGPTIGNSP